MKKFTAHISDGRKEEEISFHSAYRGESVMNRADCIREMKFLEISREEWKIIEIGCESSYENRA